jgi:hypothetical protein
MVVKDFSLRSVWIGSDSHQSFCSTSAGCPFLKFKRPGREATHISPSNDEFKDDCSCGRTPDDILACTGTTLLPLLLLHQLLCWLGSSLLYRTLRFFAVSLFTTLCPEKDQFSLRFDRLSPQNSLYNYFSIDAVISKCVLRHRCAVFCDLIFLYFITNNNSAP